MKKYLIFLILAIIVFTNNINAEKNYYEILEIERTATLQQIREAYKELAKKLHPYKNLERKEEAEEKFKEIKNAYDILSDPITKANYDKTLPHNFEIVEYQENKQQYLPDIDFSYGGDFIYFKINNQHGFNEVKQYIQNRPGIVMLQLELEKGVESIPEDFFENMTNLKEFTIDPFPYFSKGEKLIDLPESIGKLTNLINLNLTINRLPTLPDSIGNLTNLEILKLDFNPLVILPESIGNLIKLQILDLQNNHLTSLPESMGKLTKLKKLNLSHNSLTNLPESLPETLKQRMKNRQLDIDYSLSKEFDSFRIKITNVYDFSGIITEKGFDEVKHFLQAEPEIVELRLILGGEARRISIPEDYFEDLSRLTKLELQNNDLIKLPKSIKSLTNLEELNLSNNRLANLPESLPSEIKQKWNNGNGPLKIIGIDKQKPLQNVVIQPVSLFQKIGSRIRLAFSRLFRRTA